MRIDLKYSHIDTHGGTIKDDGCVNLNSIMYIHISNYMTF